MTFRRDATPGARYHADPVPTYHQPVAIVTVIMNSVMKVKAASCLGTI